MVGNTYFCNIHDFNGCKLPSSFVTTLDLLRKEIFKFVFHDFTTKAHKTARKCQT